MIYFIDAFSRKNLTKKENIYFSAFFYPLGDNQYGWYIATYRSPNPAGEYCSGKFGSSWNYI